MELEILLAKSFRVYSQKMNKIYSELNSIKESCSYEDSQLLMEGFWDKLKSAAAGVGSFLGKTTQKVSNFSKDVYNKGVELGKKAVEVGKELVNKVSEVSKNALNAIKNAPGRFLDACKDLYSSVSNEVGEIWKKAKEKGGEWLQNAKQTIINVYTTVSTNLKEGMYAFKNWASKNIEEFKKMVAARKDELLEAAKSALSSANEVLKKVGQGIKSFYEVGKKAVKNIALFTIAIAVLPLYGAFLLAKKTYELGEDAVSYISSGIESIKKNAPDVWNEFTKSFEAGMKEPAVAEGFVIKTFESFINKKY